MGFSYISERSTKRQRPLATPLTVAGMILEGRCCGDSFQAKTFKNPLGGSLTTVYKAKRASSVRSAFLREPLGAWAGFASGGDDNESAVLTRSSRNLSKSKRWKWICLIQGDIKVAHSHFFSLFFCAMRFLTSCYNENQTIPSLVTPSLVVSPFL